MKTIAKLMALCLLLGMFAFAQTGGDKDKKSDDKSASSDKDSKGKKGKKGKKDKKDKDSKGKDDKGGDKK